MVSEPREESIQTLPDLLSAIPNGSSAVLLLENELLSHQLLPKILHSLPEKGIVRLFTGRMDDTISQSRRRLEIVDIRRVKSPRDLRTLLLRQLRSSKKGDLFVFDFSSTGRLTGRAIALARENLTVLLRKKKLQSIWLLSAESTGFTTLQGPKSDDLLARIWTPGGTPLLWFQVLNSPKAASPDVFIPRIIGEVKGTLTLHPVSSQPVGEAAPSGMLSSRNPLEEIFQKSTHGNIVFDLTGSFRQVNKVASQLLGYDEPSLRTITLRDVIIPEHWFRAKRQLCALRQRKNVSASLSIRRANNKIVTIDIDAFSLGGGLHAAHIRTSESIKERPFQKEREHADPQASLVADSPIPQAIYDNRKVIVANKAFELFRESLGMQSSPVSLSQFLGNRNRGLAKELFSAAAEGLTVEREVELSKEGEEPRTFRLVARNQTENKRTLVQCSFIETTTLAKKEREQHRDIKELSHLLRECAGPIIVLSDTRIVLATTEAALLFGYPDPGAMSGLASEAILGVKGRGSVVEKLLGGDSTADKRSTDVTGIRKDGSTFTLFTTAGKAVLSGEPVVVLQLTDVSAVRTRQDNLNAEVNVKAFLLEVDRGFSVSEDLMTILEAGLGVLLKALRFDMGAVFLQTTEGLSIAVEKGMDEKLRAMLTEKGALDGFASLVVKTAEPLVLDTGKYPPHIPLRSHFETAQIKHAVCIPLRSGDLVNGIILTCTRKAKGPAPEIAGAMNEAGIRLGQLVANAIRLNEVRKSEDHYRSLLEALPDIAYRANHQGAITYISPNVEALLNYRSHDFTRSPELWRQIVHPDDKAVYGRRLSSATTDGRRLVLEYRVLPRGKAAYRWIRDSILGFRDAGGALASMTGSVTDITDEKSRLEQLMTAGTMKANVLESIREGVAVYDSDLRCRDWNRAMEEITGLSREAVIGLPIGKTTIRVVSLELVAMLQSALNGQTVSSDDIIMNTGGSGESFYWVRCFPLKDGTNAIQGVVLTFTDVTARRALEQSVRESEETLRNVIDGMGDALMISDLQGRVWEVNKEFTRITGYSRRDVLGMSFPYPWLVDEEMARFVSWIAELRERSFLRDFDMTWHSQDGRKVAISINTSLLRNASGEPVAMLNIARDISDRKKLMTELERRNRELETLNVISASITTSFDLEEVLKRSGEQIREVMSAAVVLIYLKDPRRNRLSLGCHAGLSEESAAMIRELHPSESATGAVITAGKPLLISSGLSDDPRITREGREILRTLQLNSLGVIPLRSKDHVLGALDVGFQEDHDFTDDDQQFLALIGAQLGSAIENAQLYDEVRRQVRRLTSLSEVGRGLAGSLDLKTILSTVYGEVSKAIPAERFTYFVYSEMKETVLPVLEFSNDPSDVNSMIKKEVPVMRGGPFRRVLDQNSAVLFSANDTDGAMIIAPVRSGQTIAGFLVVQGSSADLDDEAHLRLLESIATLTELALDKASLYVDIVNKSKQIEIRNKELDDFTYVVSHDLKEPLISIEGYSKILLKEFSADIGSEGKEYLASLVSSSTRLKNLIDDLLTLSRLGRVTEATQDVSLSQTVAEVLQDLQFTIRERNVVVAVGESLPVVRYNPTQLSIVIRNLVSNAIKFNRRDEPRISITCVTTDREHVVSFSDNGIGIEEEYFEKIFMIFQRLHRTEEFRGTGAGLTIVKKIVENHGGMVIVESTPNEGSVFSFTIPLRLEQ